MDTDRGLLVPSTMPFTGKLRAWRFLRSGPGELFMSGYISSCDCRQDIVSSVRHGDAKRMAYEAGRTPTDAPGRSSSQATCCLSCVLRIFEFVSRNASTAVSPGGRGLVVGATAGFLST